MTYTVQIESVLAVPADAVVAALSAGGVNGTVLETDPCLLMDVDADDGDGLGARIGHALETLIASRRLSLVPERIGHADFVLRPPAA
jgi:hypothetical protein